MCGEVEKTFVDIINYKEMIKSPSMFTLCYKLFQEMET